MVRTKRWGVWLLVGALWGCGDDGSDASIKDPDDQMADPGDGDANATGKIKVCDVVSVAQVSEILGGASYTSQATENDYASICNFDTEDEDAATLAVTVQHNGAAYYEETRETLAETYDGTATKDESGLGEAAFSHYWLLDVTDTIKIGTVSLVAIKSGALVDVVVGQINLSEAEGLEKAKKIMALVLAEID